MRERRREKKMKGTTHLASGLVLAAMAPTQTLAVSAGLVVGSLLPDIDTKSSLLGRHVPILPKLLKHRGFTHSLILPLVLFLFDPTRALSVGMLAHLLLDAFNPDGIPILWPCKKRFSIPFVNKVMKSGGFVDGLMGCCLWGSAIYIYVNLALGSSLAALLGS